MNIECYCLTFGVLFTCIKTSYPGTSESMFGNKPLSRTQPNILYATCQTVIAYYSYHAPDRADSSRFFRCKDNNIPVLNNPDYGRMLADEIETNPSETQEKFLKLLNFLSSSDSTGDTILAAHTLTVLEMDHTDDAVRFHMCGHKEPLTKDDLLAIKTVHMPAFLACTVCFIMTYRTNNRDGKKLREAVIERNSSQEYNGIFSKYISTIKVDREIVERDMSEDTATECNCSGIITVLNFLIFIITTLRNMILKGNQKISVKNMLDAIVDKISHE